MKGHLSKIIGRNKKVEIEPATAADFALSDTAEVSASIVLEQPGWSPYCLDPHEQSLTFVRLPPDIDLSRAPFYFVEQYHRAEELLSVPIADVHQLARELPDPKLIFIFSIGRCGTTLANHAVNGAAGAWSISEPEVTFPRALRQMTVVPHAALVSDLCRLLYATRFDRAASTLCLKFRSQTLFAGEDFFAARPDAKYVFMYRDALSWSDSFLQFFIDVGAPIPLPRPVRNFAWGLISGDAPLKVLGRSIDLNARMTAPEGVIAAAWVRYLETYLALLDRGVPFLALRYNELVSDRQGELARLFRHCGLSEADVAQAMRAFDEDSQKGTVVGQKGDKAKFGPEAIATIKTILAGNAPLADPELILPDIYDH